MFGGAATVSAQELPPYATGQRQGREDKRLPDGRLQSEAMLKEDHKKNLEELKKMRDLIASVEDEIEKSGGHVLSMENLKKLEEVEKLSKRIRDRMRRF